MRSTISAAKALARSIGLMPQLWRVAFAQEQDTVSWDPRETGQLELNFKTVSIGLLIALGCVGLWKLLVWLLEKNRWTITWSRVRLVWPTAMLIWGCVMLAMFMKNESWGWWFDAILVLFGVVNFPALMPVVVILGFLNESFQLPVWLRVTIGSIIFWSGNYLVTRVVEWTAWSKVPVSLQLVDRK